MWTKVKQSIVDKQPAKFVPSAILDPIKQVDKRLAPAEILARRTAYLKVLRRERHYVAVAKPPGTICQDEDETSILHHMRLFLPRLFGRHEHPFHAPKGVHRLDKPVTGCLLFGTSVHGTRALSKILHNRQMIKGYLALLCRLDNGRPCPLERLDSGRIIEEGQETSWTVLARLRRTHNGPITYLCWLRPLQGRKHQLRIHAAVNLNAPILFEYEDIARAETRTAQRGAGYFRKTWGEGIALHCAEMIFSLSLDRHVVRCEPPDFGVWEQVRQEYGIDWADVLEQGQLWTPRDAENQVRAPMRDQSAAEMNQEAERRTQQEAQAKKKESELEAAARERERDAKRDVLDLLGDVGKQPQRQGKD